MLGGATAARGRPDESRAVPGLTTARWEVRDGPARSGLRIAVDPHRLRGRAARPVLGNVALVPGPEPGGFDDPHRPRGARTPVGVPPVGVLLGGGVGLGTRAEPARTGPPSARMSRSSGPPGGRRGRP